MKPASWPPVSIFETPPLNSTRVEATFAVRSTCNEPRRSLNAACAAGLALVRADLARCWSGWKSNHGLETAVGGAAVLGEQEEGRGQASCPPPDNGGNQRCDQCFSQWILREVFGFLLGVFSRAGRRRTGTARLWMVFLWGAGSVLSRCSNQSWNETKKRQKSKIFYLIYTFSNLLTIRER